MSGIANKLAVSGSLAKVEICVHPRQSKVEISRLSVLASLR
jgi:hypothetical protein